MKLSDLHVSSSHTLRRFRDHQLRRDDRRCVCGRPLAVSLRVEAFGTAVDDRGCGYLGLHGRVVGRQARVESRVLAWGKFLIALLCSGGFSWYGGLFEGLAMGILALRRRAPVLRVLAAATPAFAAGHLLGRIGYFLVGDDYGRPSSLPWVVAFPDGRPPTTVLYIRLNCTKRRRWRGSVGLCCTGAPRGSRIGSCLAATSPRQD